jgi:4-amino-4-deoxy-L-arabinose transferase-like glycosyltransferase
MQRNHDQRPREPSAPRPSAGAPQRRVDGSFYFLLLATVGFFLARIPVLPLREFDPDEFEHTHAAWCVFKGMIPYKDFFEHHTPFYYYVLSPFFHWFDVDLSFESARHFLLFGRGLSLLLTMLSVFIVYRIGRLWQSRRVGIVAALFIVGQPVFFQKTVEIRPDVLALPFFLGGLWFLLRGLGRSAESPARGLRYFLGGGLALGAAIMCTQKMLFVLPGMCLGLGVWAVLGEDKSRRRARLAAIALLFAGLAIAPALTWIAFTLRHAGGELIANNFLLNAEWRSVVHQQLLRTLASSWPVLLLCLLGATVWLYHFVRSSRREHGGVLLLGTLLGLVAGILVVPVAHRQYYLMPLPIACLFAAHGLSFLVERAPERARSYLLVLATLPLLVLPILGLRESFTTPNDRQLARLRYVFESTNPTDLVMDGWQGTGVFRPHAFYYFFVHEELLPMLPHAQVQAFVAALTSGKIRPRLIALDKNLIGLGSGFVRFVEQNYTSNDGFFYVSRRPP